MQCGTPGKSGDMARVVGSCSKRRSRTVRYCQPAREIHSLNAGGVSLKGRKVVSDAGKAGGRDISIWWFL